MKNKETIIIGVIIIIALTISGIIFTVKKQTTFSVNKEALKNISYDISDKFEYNEYGDSRSYHYYKTNISCTFRVDSHENKYYHYKNGKDFLEDRVYITLKDKVSEIKETEINNYKWYYLTVENDGNIKYYYSTIKDTKIYELEFTISDYLNGDGEKDDFCAKQYDKIISSLELK